MAKLVVTILTVLSLAASIAAAPAIKATTKLTIQAVGKPRVEITRQDLLQSSNVFAGQFIGTLAATPSSALTRYMVSFDVQTNSGVKRGAYVVHYVFDDASGEAFLYLPGRGEVGYRRNLSTIIRDGQDGRWHHADASWASSLREYLR